MMQDSSVKSQQETESKEVKDDVTEALEVQVKVKSLMPLFCPEYSLITSSRKLMACGLTLSVEGREGTVGESELLPSQRPASWLL